MYNRRYYTGYDSKRYPFITPTIEWLSRARFLIFPFIIIIICLFIIIIISPVNPKYALIHHYNAYTYIPTWTENNEVTIILNIVVRFNPVRWIRARLNIIVYPMVNYVNNDGQLWWNNNIAGYGNERKTGKAYYNTRCTSLSRNSRVLTTPFGETCWFRTCWNLLIPHWDRNAIRRWRRPGEAVLLAFGIRVQSLQLFYTIIMIYVFTVYNRRWIFFFFFSIKVKASIRRRIFVRTNDIIIRAR